MKISLILTIISFTLACSPGEQETQAHIIQRRARAVDRLMISYRFSAKGRVFFDSMETSNRIIPHDSVTVMYSPRNPQNSRLKLP